MSRCRDPQPFSRAEDGLWVRPYFDRDGQRKRAYGATNEDALAKVRHNRQALAADLYTHLVEDEQRSHVERLNDLAGE